MHVSWPGFLINSMSWSNFSGFPSTGFNNSLSIHNFSSSPFNFSAAPEKSFGYSNPIGILSTEPKYNFTASGVPSSFDDSRVMQSIKKHEAFKDTSYKCTQGFPTIGWGHKCEKNEACANPGFKIDKTKAEQYFQQDYQKAKKAAEKFGYSPRATEILTEMAFQMGTAGIGDPSQETISANKARGLTTPGFPKMHQCLRNKDYKGAADDMLDSAWAKTQTPARAKKLADEMRKIAPGS